MTPLLPGSAQPVTLGVLGGGQLGRMFIHAAQRLGYGTVVLDPDAGSPAGVVSHHHIHTGYEDQQGLQRMRQLCAAVTTEFENVPAPTMAALARHLPVSPDAHALSIAQDRRLEKAHFMACNVPCAPYAVIDSADALAAVPAQLLPGILKTARMGYDGKGQARVADADALADAWQRLGQVPCVLEQALDLGTECSVVLARGRDGSVVHFPVQRNLHRDGILAVTEVFDGNIAPALARQAIEAARTIAQGLDYVGVLCVEFFLLRDGTLLVNEIAPRPHNSGHYSIDACDHSQFDLQVYALAGLPLPMPHQHSSAVMLNLLGDLWFDPAQPAAGPRTPDWAALLALPGAHLHLYGKAEPRAGRKMGHLTLTGRSAARVRVTAKQAADLLGLSFETS